MLCNFVKQNALLKRERVNRLIADGLSEPILLIRSGSETGKTAAVRGFLESYPESSWAFVKMFSADADEKNFWTKITTELSERNEEAFGKLKTVPFPESARTVSSLAVFLRKSVRTDFILVIDSFHRVQSNAKIAGLMASLADEDLGHFHIILISRPQNSDWEVPLYDNIRCHTLTAEDLALSPSEIGEFTALLGIFLSDEEMERLYEATAGWIAAVQFVCTEIYGGEGRGALTIYTDRINVFYENRFVPQIEANNLEALTRLSVLDEFTLSQASFLLGGEDIFKLLKYICMAYPCITWQKNRNCFRLNERLNEFLELRLQFKPDEYKAALCRAGEWFVRSGDYGKALTYYCKGGDIGTLLSYWNRPNSGQNRFLGGEVLKYVLDQPDSDDYIRYPFPLLHGIFEYVITGDRKKSEEALSLLNKICDYYSEAKSEYTERVLGEAEIIKAVASGHNAHGIMSHLVKADTLLDSPSELVEPDDSVTSGIPQSLFAFGTESGDSDFLNDIDEALLKRIFPEEFICGFKKELQAEIALARGNIEDAKEYATQTIYECEENSEFNLLVAAQLVLGRVCLASGDREGALAICSKLRQQAMNCDNTMNCQCRLAIAYLASCMGQDEIAAEELTDKQLFDAMSFRGLGYPETLKARINLSQHDSTYSEYLCNVAETAVAHSGSLIGRINCGILRSILRERSFGDGEQILIEALNLAASENYIQIFAEYGKNLLPILEKLGEDSGVDMDFLLMVQSTCANYPDYLASDKAPLIPLLTGREVEVISCFAEGMTRKTVAETLFISEATVKHHLINIYQKLGVSNRVSAINRAKELKIIK